MSYITPPSHRPSRIFLASGVKIKDWDSMGISILMHEFFWLGILNLIVSNSENSVGIGKTTRYFSVRIFLFHPIRRAWSIIFHWGRYFDQFFQWEGVGPSGSVRRGCYISRSLWYFVMKQNCHWRTKQLTSAKSEANFRASEWIPWLN